MSTTRALSDGTRVTFYFSGTYGPSVQITRGEGLGFVQLPTTIAHELIDTIVQELGQEKPKCPCGRPLIVAKFCPVCDNDD